MSDSRPVLNVVRRELEGQIFRAGFIPLPPASAGCTPLCLAPRPTVKVDQDCSLRFPRDLAVFTTSPEPLGRRHRTNRTIHSSSKAAMLDLCGFCATPNLQVAVQAVKTVSIRNCHEIFFLYVTIGTMPPKTPFYPHSER